MESTEPEQPTSVESNTTEESPLDGTEITPNPASGKGSTTPDIEMFMNVNMTVSVEVGSAEVKLKDLLNLSKGSVLELNKSAGELLDILANGKLIARGEVVAINGKYGVRLVSIASKNERAAQA